MSFARGLIAGLSIAVLQVGSRVRPADPARGGWTWASQYWARRSSPRMVACTVALVLGAALAPAIDRFAFAPADVGALGAMALDLATPVGAALALLVPAVAIAAVLFWLFASERLPVRFLPLALGYLAGLPFAVLYPPVAIGTVGGTAAGHAWHSPGSRTAIAFLVVVLALLGTFGPPLLRLQLRPDAPIARPTLSGGRRAAAFAAAAPMSQTSRPIAGPTRNRMLITTT